jgi:hypothetical protein
MTRGGKREGAGRPTSWTSGVKFEETVLIRVPRFLKEKLLDIAHQLDAGEDINVDINAVNREQEIESLQLKLAEAEELNQQLSQDIENRTLDLDTKSKVYEEQIFTLKQQSENFQSKIVNLEQQNQELSYQIISINFDLDTKSKLINQIKQNVLNWQKDFTNLSPLGSAAKLNQVLSEIKKIAFSEVLEENYHSEIPDLTVQNEVQPTQTPENFDLVTKLPSHPQISAIDLVTNIDQNTQLSLPVLNDNENNSSLKPLTIPELAKRFQLKDTSNLYKMRKNNTKFSKYTKSRDPQGIEWQYDEKTKLFHPII